MRSQRGYSYDGGAIVADNVADADAADSDLVNGATGREAAAGEGVAGAPNRKLRSEG